MAHGAGSHAVRSVETWEEAEDRHKVAEVLPPNGDHIIWSNVSKSSTFGGAPPSDIMFALYSRARFPGVLADPVEAAHQFASWRRWLIATGKKQEEGPAWKNALENFQVQHSRFGPAYVPQVFGPDPPFFPPVVTTRAAEIVAPRASSAPVFPALSLAELPAAFSLPQLAVTRQTVYPSLVTAPLAALEVRPMPIVQSLINSSLPFLGSEPLGGGGGGGGGAGILDVITAGLGAAGQILPAVIANRQAAPSGAGFSEPYGSPEEVGRGVVTGTALETMGGAAPVGWHATRTGYRPNRFITASGALFEHVGRPVLFARDFAAVQRVRSVARRAAKVLGGGARRRGKGR